MRGKSLKWFVLSVLMLLIFSGNTVTAQQKPPQLKGGAEAVERIKNPVSNIILQQRYPDTVILRGPTNENRVALTFDDGPDPRYTPQVLDVLKGYNVKATFFLMGSRAEAYPDLVKRIKDEGHIIGNHTYWHPNLVKQGSTAVVETEIKNTEDRLNGLIGYRTKLFRPPYGFLTNELVEKVRDLNYKVIGWNVDSLDWQEAAPEVIAYNVISKIEPGSIILMHDGAEWDGDRTNTIKSLRQIIPALKEQGMVFETVPALLNTPYKK